MRNAVGNHNDVAFGQMMLLASGDFRGADFAGRNRVRIHRRSSRHERGRAFGYIKDIGVLFMDFYLTGRDPSAAARTPFWG